MSTISVSLGGTKDDTNASVITALDSVSVTDGVSSMGTWSATVPYIAELSDDIFSDVYIYNDDEVLFQGELESFDRNDTAGTTTMSGRGALVVLDRDTTVTTYTNTTVFDALNDLWSTTPYDAGVLPPNRELYDNTFTTTTGHESLWSWSGDDPIITSGVSATRNKLVFTQTNTLLDDDNSGTQLPSIRTDTPVDRLGYIIKTTDPVTKLDAACKRVDDGNNIVETVWDSVTHNSPQRYHYFDFEMSATDDRFRPALQTYDSIVSIEQTDVYAPDPDDFSTINSVDLEGTTFEVLQELHELGSYGFTVRDFETLDITSVPVNEVAPEPNWRVIESTRTLDFTDYANKVTVHGKTADDGSVATATTKNQAEIDELNARGVGTNGVISTFEKNTDLETQSEVDSRAERLLELSVNERDESGSLEITPTHVAPGFTYPVSAWGDAFPYGSQIGKNSLYFDGNSYVDYTFNIGFEGAEGNVLTTEMLVSPDGLASLGDDEYQTLLEFEIDVAVRVIRLYGDGSIEFGKQNSGSNGSTRTAPNIINDRESQRLSIVWNRTPDPRIVYVNGQEKARFTDDEYYAAPIVPDNIQSNRLGADGNGNHGFVGGIDDVRFWADTAPRTQQEIIDTHDIDLVETDVDLSPLVVYFRFDDDTDPTTATNDGDVESYTATITGASYQDERGQLEEVSYTLGQGETITLDFDISGRIDTELINTRKTSRSNKRSL